MGTLTLVLRGGLGNRLLALTSGLVLARHLNCRLKIVWRIDRLQCGCPLPLLLENFEDAGEILPPDPDAWHYHSYNNKSCEELETRLKQGQNVHLHACRYCPPVAMAKAQYEDLIRAEFAKLRPAAPIRERLAEIALPPDTIGVQIRRGDHWRVIRYSPLSLFVRLMDRHRAERPDVPFYLATDSIEVGAYLRKRYGKSILQLRPHTSRGSMEGVRDALADMLYLSRTSRIYLSPQSTFAYVAHMFSGVPLYRVGRRGMPSNYSLDSWDRGHDKIMFWHPVLRTWKIRSTLKNQIGVRARAWLYQLWNSYICSSFYQLRPHRMASFSPERMEDIYTPDAMSHDETSGPPPTDSIDHLV